MDALSNLLRMPPAEKSELGLLYTPGEIAQQPDTWASTFALFQKRKTEIAPFLRSAGILGPYGQRPTIFLLGAGTSDYIGRSLIHLLRRTWQCEVIAVPSTDVVTHFGQLLLPEQKYLWLSFSRSGDSPESVAAVEMALTARPDIHHIIISCNPSGRMTRETTGNRQVFSVCLDDSVNDRGLAMTSSFSNMVVFGQCLAHIEDVAPYEKVLGHLIDAGKRFLVEAADSAAELAKGDYEQACFVGSGPLRAVASESALKLLELTAGRTSTMSESALGLRHGPMAALNEQTLFVSFMSSEEHVRKYETDLLDEIGNKHLVKTRVAVGSCSNVRGSNCADLLVLPDTTFAIPGDYRPAVDVIFGQLLGLFFSLRWNLKPDCPSPNGAISRVVQGVKIYS